MITGTCRTRIDREITYKNVHFRKHVICLNKLMGDTHALWLHGMVNAVGVRANVGWEKGETKE